MKVEIGGWSRADGSQILVVEIDEQPVFEIAGVLEPSPEFEKAIQELAEAVVRRCAEVCRARQRQHDPAQRAMLMNMSAESQGQLIERDWKAKEAEKCALAIEALIGENDAARSLPDR